jgi:hypothetical protein
MSYSSVIFLFCISNSGQDQLESFMWQMSPFSPTWEWPGKTVVKGIPLNDQNFMIFLYLSSTWKQWWSDTQVKIASLLVPSGGFARNLNKTRLEDWGQGSVWGTGPLQNTECKDTRILCQCPPEGTHCRRDS